MPRKPNYGLNKHRKEQDRKARKDAKLLEKQQRRDERAQGDVDSDTPGTSGPGAASQLPPAEEM